jgi:hypothetical protein
MALRYASSCVEPGGNAAAVFVGSSGKSVAVDPDG